MKWYSEDIWDPVNLYETGKLLADLGTGVGLSGGLLALITGGIGVAAPPAWLVTLVSADVAWQALDWRSLGEYWMEEAAKAITAKATTVAVYVFAVTDQLGRDENAVWFHVAGSDKRVGLTEPLTVVTQSVLRSVNAHSGDYRQPGLSDRIYRFDLQTDVKWR